GRVGSRRHTALGVPHYLRRAARADRCHPCGRGCVMTEAVTMHVWRVRPRDVPAAVMTSRITAHRLRRNRDITFAKVLGTATDAFVPTAPTLQRWVALVCRQGPEPVCESWWERHAVEQASLSLRPMSSRGRWDGRDPFVVRRPDDGTWAGPVVALTRSTL